MPILSSGGYSLSAEGYGRLIALKLEALQWGHNP
jgi:hypothetical protein